MGSNTGWGYDPVQEDHGDLPITDPWPTSLLRDAELLRRYPCLNVVAGRYECGKPSARPALGNEARYGHVCEQCWQSFDEAEQRRYAEVGVARRAP